jgi:hypothetical protein
MSKLHPTMKWAFSFVWLAFAGLMTATYITVKIANQGHESVVDPQYYEKGLNYEKEIESQKKLSKLGFSFRSPTLEDGYAFKQGKNPIEIEFLKIQEKVLDAKLTVSIERGATQKYNSVTELSINSDGKYIGDLEVPLIGEWYLTVTASTEEGSLSKTVLVKTEQ